MPTAKNIEPTFPLDGHHPLSATIVDLYETDGSADVLSHMYEQEALIILQ